jgi:type I restriction enzyme S subunit
LKVTSPLERLGDLCDVVRGSSPRPKGDPRYFGGTIPWVTIRDVTLTRGRYLRQTAETVTEAGRDQSRYVAKGSLIVSNSATIGLPIFMGTGGCIHDGFLTFQNLDDKLTLGWLYWFFLSARQNLSALAPEGTQKNLNTDIVENLRIPLPSVPEQERIASHLAHADDLTRARRYALNLSSSLVRISFKEQFARPLVDGPFLALGDLVTITGGGTPSRSQPDYFRGDIPWLTPKDMRGDYIWDTEEHVTQEAIDKSATKLVPADSILVVVKSKVLMRRLPLAITRVALCHGQDIKSLQCHDGFHPEFLRAVIEYYESRLLRLARGANTEGLTLPMLQELPVPDVGDQEQECFVELVGGVQKLRATHREALRQAEHLSASLLHEAFPPEE